ncbi:hypothetical protein DH2020_009572 [Rehmannia glutinosa]|uniref:Uncharacterized protein n=1 Tax=Rehmannia glutinosa TaxID=99300 RepID=A0ABR0X9D8_REHGL
MAEKNSKDLLKLEANTTAVASTSCLESKLFVCKKDTTSLSEAPLQKPSMFPVPKSHDVTYFKIAKFIHGNGGKLYFPAVVTPAKPDNPESYDIEVLNGKESEYIEMDLMLGVADLHTPEAVAAAESALAGCPPLVPLAESSSGSESEYSSDEEDDDEEEDKIKEQDYKKAERDSSREPLRKQKSKKRSKIVELS